LDDRFRSAHENTRNFITRRGMIMNRTAQACLLITMGFALYGCATQPDRVLQHSEVPAAVLQSFSSAYPAAKVLKYEEEFEKGQKIYEIDFLLGKQEYEAEYNAQGKLLKVERDD
jgi:hypothetical protein